MGNKIYMKNIVFIPNIDLGNGRNNAYHYSIDSWKAWCDKNNCELLVWEDLLFPVDYMKVTWQRYYLFDILEANDINYDQILMVDADTIVHPDCPNFFVIADGKYCGVMNDGDYEWVLRSIRGFGDELFNGMRVNPWNYINGGFQILNKNHKEFFESMKKYYNDNSSLISDTILKLKTATDQTILNLMLHKNQIDVKVLPDCYNLQDLTRKNLLYIDKSCWWSDELHYLNAGWVYHFNAIPQNNMGRDVNYWMKRTYEELYV
jgi:lipopolysaccharide biosynthesis glycosyltransferase